MKLKEQKWATCNKCKQRTHLIQEESYGCDYCRKPINDLLGNLDNKQHHFLEIKVFFNEKPTEDYQFCSWKCVFKKLRTIKTDYFIDLPFLNFNIENKGQTVDDFLKCILK